MHALEMEEVESLVAPSSKSRTIKTLGGNKNNNNMLAAAATNKNFLTRLVVGAIVIMLFLMYISSDGSGDSNAAIPPPVDDEPMDDATTSANNNSNSVVGGSATADSPIPAPVTPPTPVVTPPVAPPTGGDASSSSSSSSSTSDSEKVVTDSVTFKDGDYLYSKFATIVPFPDHPMPNKKVKDDLAEKWGHWHFWDGDEEDRPDDDYLAEYPNRDIPSDDFPDDSWQTDAVFVNHYLNDADKLISRAMEAIYTEYGHGKPLEPAQLAERMKMFHWEVIDLANEGTTEPEKYSRRGDRGNGGWTTKRSQQGLVRRLLHAMMTSDTFTVVLGGHSAAVGQGNHFRQSYMMQFHKIMYPVFARLGVKLITRNMAQGGLGTMHSSMGSGSIYGNEVDLLLWDSGMTEPDAEHVDLFLRQALIGGNRVPVVWGGHFELLKMLHNEASADVGQFGNGMDGIIPVESAEQAKSVPWAARYLKCTDEAKNLCDEEERFCSHCWITRDDGIEPEQKQLDKPRGRVKWHPGWRFHQLQGRALAFSVLQALQTAVNIYSDGVMGGPPLDEDLWHVTEYYDKIRKKVKNLDPSLGKCNEIGTKLPARMCKTPMKAKTQYTPRANFEESSLTSIIKPTSDGYVPKNEKKALYDRPDVHNECLDIPEEGIDVYDIVSGRRRLKDMEVSVEQQILDDIPKTSSAAVNRSLAEISPGKGWQVFGEPQGYCDGTYSAICGRSTDNECVLYGHHDERGAVIGNEFSGWLVMNLKDLKEGIIVIKLHTWHYDSENTVTKGWTTVNNERRLRRGENSELAAENAESLDFLQDHGSGERTLMRSYETPELPDDFVFEYAIDGQITSLSKTDFLEKKQQVQRVVETLTLLDDENFTSEKKDVEVAIRMARGCDRKCTFGVSHIYWA